MKIQQLIPLSDIYNREEDFSTDLADNLDALRVGSFEDARTESNINKRRADIVAVGEDGILVVENQFGEADWDHWGRLEAYTRVQDATVAALVAESFEDLMIVTCNRRNEESSIGWYLIQVQANEYKELSFHHVARPAIDIQVGSTSDIEYSEFWEPIRRAEFGELFAGRPVPISNDRWISKSIRNIGVTLFLTNQRCYIQLYFQGKDRLERRDKVMALFPESDYLYEYNDSPKQIRVQFPVLDKGRNDQDNWDEIREELVNKGIDIYNKINEF